MSRIITVLDINRQTEKSEVERVSAGTKFFLLQIFYPKINNFLLLLLFRSLVREIGKLNFSVLVRHFKNFVEIQLNSTFDKNEEFIQKI